MRHTLLLAILATFALTACDKNPADEPFVTSPQPASALPPGHPAVSPDVRSMGTGDTDETAQTEQATVLSTIDIEGFTYIEIEQHRQARWLAANSIKLKKGDLIKFDSGSTIDDFTSKVLDRTFPSMTFVNNVSIIKGK